MTPVIVGVDDSEDGLRAVEWAAAEAVRRRRPLRIVHAFIWPLLNVPLGPVPGGPPEGGLQHAAERVLDTARARAQAVAPGVEVTTDLPEGEPVTALLHHSREAELLVVGSRGLGEVGGLLLGSVGARLAAEADCPVVVVRGSARPGGPVVVGIADPGESEALLAFACAHAARTADPVMLAHVGPADPGRPPLPDPDLARWRERFPTVTFDQETLTGRPGKALTHAAEQASLLVVGSHHRHELGALLHGSVSQNVLHHAGCPVAVIRGGA
ncbi:nucleotide-binding universal stress UspA family protein [Nonomuraea thailandensis]|uniref:Nucleotide-binding universal stress UspA family protein n=1 Tax=Nonomuraea thailandensis TaxID=1188745 RepID=A0A9X2GE59_9ACTN|nr:universal stress protein [Nonomuraea thailandensis]MCP2355970.1 nucleotide-binding universal stress UspA family protein [Nonomuraea thailandensis]